MITRFRTFLAGFLVLLPLAVTLTVIVWVGTFIYAYVGPESTIGRILISIGFGLSDSPFAAYALGAVIVVGLIYLLGLGVEVAPRKPGAPSDQLADAAHSVCRQSL